MFCVGEIVIWKKAVTQITPGNTESNLLLIQVQINTATSHFLTKQIIF